MPGDDDAEETVEHFDREDPTQRKRALDAILTISARGTAYFASLSVWRRSWTRATRYSTPMQTHWSYTRVLCVDVQNRAREGERVNQSAAQPVADSQLRARPHLASNGRTRREGFPLGSGHTNFRGPKNASKTRGGVQTSRTVQRHERCSCQPDFLQILFHSRDRDQCSRCTAPYVAHRLDPMLLENAHDKPEQHCPGGIT